MTELGSKAASPMDDDDAANAREAWLAAICVCPNKASRHACDAAAEVMAKEVGRGPDDYNMTLLGVTRGL